LDAQQVNTIRRMLTGAVAGLGPQAIEVIDLSEGVAKQGFTGALVDPQQHALEAQQRTDQQRRLRSKILAALQRFPGVEVDVRLTQCKFQSRENSLPTVVPAKPQMQLTAGSNGVASIIASAASPQPPVQSVGFDRSQETNTCEVAVQVDLPEVALENIAMSLMLRPTLDSVGQKRDVVGEKFAVIRPQIQQEVASLLPAAWRDQSGPSPVQVTLHRAEVAKAVTVSDRAMQMARQHWPSVAALLVGLTLLSIVLRKPASDQVTDAATAEPNVLPMSLAEGNPAPDSQTKEQLDRLLQDHPEAAARALEDWVRNAG
jgi:hypothetical protein